MITIIVTIALQGTFDFYKNIFCSCSIFYKYSNKGMLPQQPAGNLNFKFICYKYSVHKIKISPEICCDTF